jgi:phosphohistidine phosphatase
LELWLIRHAEAVPRDLDLEDSMRPLTPKGRRRFEQEVRGLVALGVSFDALHHSPWLRAAETASALRPLVTGKILSTPDLARPPDERLLESLSGERIALVGHEPWMSELLAWLVLGTREAAGGFAFKKGGVAWLEGEPRPAGMLLRALFPPKVLVELSRG